MSGCCVPLQCCVGDHIAVIHSSCIMSHDHVIHHDIIACSCNPEHDVIKCSCDPGCRWGSYEGGQLRPLQGIQPVPGQPGYSAESRQCSCQEWLRNSQCVWPVSGGVCVSLSPTQASCWGRRGAMPRSPHCRWPCSTSCVTWSTGGAPSLRLTSGSSFQDRHFHFTTQITQQPLLLPTVQHRCVYVCVCVCVCVFD